MTKAQSWKGKAALITGASRGIGRACAVALAKQGMNVALSARTKETLEETAELCRAAGAKAVIIAGNIADPETWTRAVDTTVKELGGLAVLINNAGLYQDKPTLRVDFKAWDETIDVNLRAVMGLTHKALPHIVAAKGGAVICLSSVLGKMVYPGAASYAATKHAVLGFAGTLFEEVREKNVKVSTICPGFVATDMADKPGLVQAKMIQAEDIAETVSFILNFPSTGCPTEIIVRPQQTPYQQ